MHLKSHPSHKSYRAKLFAIFLICCTFPAPQHSSLPTTVIQNTVEHQLVSVKIPRMCITNVTFSGWLGKSHGRRRKMQGGMSNHMGW